MATMSDASGFGTGGTTEVLKVGDSIGNANCNTTDPGTCSFDTPSSEISSKIIVSTKVLIFSSNSMMHYSNAGEDQFLVPNLGLTE